MPPLGWTSRFDSNVDGTRRVERHMNACRSAALAALGETPVQDGVIWELVL